MSKRRRIKVVQRGLIFPVDLNVTGGNLFAEAGGFPMSNKVRAKVFYETKYELRNSTTFYDILRRTIEQRIRGVL